MINNNITTFPTNIKRDVSLAMRDVSIPNIYEELEIDMKLIPKEYQEKKEFIDFFKLLMEKR